MGAILGFMPLIISLIGFVEKLYSGAKAGEVKKSSVLGAVQAVATGMSSVSTGGQKNTWDDIKDTAPAAIDALVGLYNVIGFPAYTGVTITDDMGVGFKGF